MALPRCLQSSGTLLCRPLSPKKYFVWTQKNCLHRGVISTVCVVDKTVRSPTQALFVVVLSPDLLLLPSRQ